MPTNEAKAAAKYLHFHAWMDEDGVLRVSGGTAEAIDRETHLPALLAVAEVARGFVDEMDIVTKAILASGYPLPSDPATVWATRLHSALGNLPK